MPSGLTITSTDFTSFVTNTVIDPSEVNNNFSTYRGHLLPVDLTASSAVNQTFFIGSPEYRYKGVHAAPILGMTTVSGAYTVGQNDNVILCSNASSAAYTITLPSAASITGKEFVIKRSDDTSTSITIDGNSSETIDGVTTIPLAQSGFIRIVSDGTNWRKIAGFHEYIQTDITSRPVSSVADTPVAGSETITVPVGTWILGYNVVWRMDDNTGSGTTYGANIHLYDGSAVIDKTQAYKTLALSTGEAFMDQTSIWTVVTFSATTTVTIRTQASVAGATGTSRIEDPEQDAGFSGDDGASRMFALRLL